MLLATGSGVPGVANAAVPMSVVLAIDTVASSLPVGGIGGWTRYYDAIQSATLTLGNVTMTMTREATGSTGLGVDNTLDLRTAPYGPLHSAGAYAYQANSGAHRLGYTPTVSTSRADFGYVMRDFYAVLEALQINSTDLANLPAMFATPVTAPQGTGVNFHVGVDFINPNWAIGEFLGGGTQYAQVGPTVSFNGRLDRVSVVTAPGGNNDPSAVPTPGTLGLVLAGASAGWLLRRQPRFAQASSRRRAA